MALDVDDLLGLLRRELSDVEEPYLWADDDLFQYLDEAQEAFARTTELFSDATTASVTRVSVTAGQPFVALSPKVHRIEGDMWLQTAKQTVSEANLNELDSLYCGDDYGHASGGRWRSATGTPRYLVLDIERDKGRLVPIPTAADTLELHVIRLPLKSVTEPGGLEVTDTWHQRALVVYAKGLAYDKNDVDTQDAQLAAQFKAEALSQMFEIRDETRRKRRRPGTVRYGGL